MSNTRKLRRAPLLAKRVAVVRRAPGWREALADSCAPRRRRRGGPGRGPKTQTMRIHHYWAQAGSGGPSLTPAQRRRITQKKRRARQTAVVQRHQDAGKPGTLAMLRRALIARRRSEAASARRREHERQAREAAALQRKADSLETIAQARETKQAAAEAPYAGTEVKNHMRLAKVTCPGCGREDVTARYLAASKVKLYAHNTKRRGGAPCERGGTEMMLDG